MVRYSQNAFKLSELGPTFKYMNQNKLVSGQLYASWKPKVKLVALPYLKQKSDDMRIPDGLSLANLKNSMIKE